MKADIKNNKLDRKVDTILGIKIDSRAKETLLNEIQAFLSKKIHFYIVTPNPEIILEAQDNPELARILNSANISIPDGVGLRIANSKIKVIKGREFMLDLFKIANDQKLKIYLFGTTKEVITKSLEKISQDFPNIKAKGSSGPKLDNEANPVSEVDTSLQFEIVKEINTFKPDILFVALGAPKQEIWIDKHLKNLSVVGAMTVGGSLDYYSKVVRPVPSVLETLGLEWLWRLIQEPKRFKRIINAVFIFPVKTLLTK